MTTIEFFLHMMTISSRYGGSCISYGRSEKHNADEGGHEDSFHLSWLAADIVFDTRVQGLQAIELAKRQNISWKWNGDRTVHFQALHPRKV